MPHRSWKAQSLSLTKWSCLPKRSLYCRNPTDQNSSLLAIRLLIKATRGRLVFASSVLRTGHPSMTETSEWISLRKRGDFRSRCIPKRLKHIPCITYVSYLPSVWHSIPLKRRREPLCDCFKYLWRFHPLQNWPYCCVWNRLTAWARVEQRRNCSVLVLKW